MSCSTETLICRETGVDHPCHIRTLRVRPPNRDALDCEEEAADEYAIVLARIVSVAALRPAGVIDQPDLVA
jgi:hypothetical protein